MSCRISHYSFGVRLQRQDAELSVPHNPFILCAAACNQGKHSSTPPASLATGLLLPSPLTTAPPVRESRNCLHYKQDILPAPPPAQMCSISQMPVILHCCPCPSNSSQWLKHRTVPSWAPKLREARSFLPGWLHKNCTRSFSASGKYCTDLFSLWLFTRTHQTL